MTNPTKTGRGLTFEVDLGAGFVKLPRLVNATPIDDTVDVVEITDLESEDKEWIPGHSDKGSVAASIRYNPNDADVAAFRATRGDGNCYQFRFTWPHAGNPTEVAWGFLTGFQVTAEGGSAIDANITLKVTPDPT